MKEIIKEGIRDQKALIVKMNKSLEAQNIEPDKSKLIEHAIGVTRQSIRAWQWVLEESELNK